MYSEAFFSKKLISKYIANSHVRTILILFVVVCIPMLKLNKTGYQREIPIVVAFGIKKNRVSNLKIELILA